MRLVQKAKYISESKKDLLQLSEFFIQVFPEMNQQEQITALTLYRILVLGKPVSNNTLAKALKKDDAVIKKIIQSWSGIFFNENNNVIGFWGLSMHETPHRMIVNGVTVYTWCAWDALFIPELLGTTVKVLSSCPVTNEPIELVVSATNISLGTNKDIAVSFLKPDIDDFNNEITTSFCHFVHFFSTRVAGEQWCAEHPNTFLLSLDDAFSIGKKMNAVRYAQTLYK